MTPIFSPPFTKVMPQPGPPQHHRTCVLWSEGIVTGHLALRFLQRQRAHLSCGSFFTFTWRFRDLLVESFRQCVATAPKVAHVASRARQGCPNWSTHTVTSDAPKRRSACTSPWRLRHRFTRQSSSWTSAVAPAERPADGHDSPPARAGTASVAGAAAAAASATPKTAFGIRS
jgi:hypothetical protein